MLSRSGRPEEPRGDYFGSEIGSSFQLCQGLAAWRETGAEITWHYFLGLLVEAHAKMGQAKEGLAVIAETLAAAPTTGRF